MILLRKRSGLLMLLVALLLLGNEAKGQDGIEKKEWKYTLGGGVQVGGMVPMPFPREIREVLDYTPSLIGYGEAALIYAWNKRWGTSIGIRFEQKGMKSWARVKNYHSEIYDDDQLLEGYWTGKVKTVATQYLVTLPVLMHYTMTKKWYLDAGIYLSYLLKGTFEGEAYEGYLRKDTPIGDKVAFMGGDKATYSFYDNYRAYTYGLQLGGGYFCTDSFAFSTQLTYGTNAIFKSSFKTISFDLYPIFLQLGVVYYF